jgi:hypothetical protein
LIRYPTEKSEGGDDQGASSDPKTA